MVATSTVMPGTTGGEIKAALEAASGRKVGPELGLCYNPEFIALGSVVRDMLYPDSILIGESDAKAGDMLQTIYLQMCVNKPPVQRMNFINAELTKISVNTYVTTKISYANMLADICDRLPGADVDAVTKALGADTRIGAKYLKGAMGYGGPCFPRDNVAFAALARKIGARADVAEATDRINNYQVDRLSGLVAKFAKAGMRIAILGLSYKPQTPVVEESHSVKLAAKLADAGYVVAVHDPLAQDAAIAALGDKVVGASSIEGAVRECDMLIVATGWPEYKAIDPAWCKRNSQRLTVLDLWRTLPPRSPLTSGAAPPGVRAWWRLGRCRVAIHLPILDPPAQRHCCCRTAGCFALHVFEHFDCRRDRADGHSTSCWSTSIAMPSADANRIPPAPSMTPEEPLAAIKRELLEETGCASEDWRLSARPGEPACRPTASIALPRGDGSPSRI
jgi:UDPglucose 6-dehydrogenase